MLLFVEEFFYSENSDFDEVVEIVIKDDSNGDKDL